MRRQRIFTRIQAMPPNSDIYHRTGVHVGNMANFVDALGLQPAVDFFLYLILAALKYRHLHRWAIFADPPNTATAIPARLKRDNLRCLSGGAHGVIALPNKCSIATNGGIKSPNSVCQALRLRRAFDRFL